MRIDLVFAATAFFALLVSCQHQKPPDRQTAAEAAGLRRGQVRWWQQLNDPALDRDIAVALATSPDLQSVAFKIDRARARTSAAKAAMKPSLNLGFGYVGGRQRNVDFGPFDLGPWQSEAVFSWEVDLNGKLQAARNAAAENERAAVWDLQSARLLLASRIAKARFSLYRLNAQMGIVEDSLKASRRTDSLLDEQIRAGVIPDSVGAKQRAETERLVRQKLDLERLRKLAIVQLRTLKGGANPVGVDRDSFPVPSSLLKQPLDKLLASHPRLLSAAADVRSAFQLEQSARLDLLPSFRITALAGGRQMNLADRFVAWTAQAGPSLDLPVYDPVRLAKVEFRQAETRLAATNYRKVVLEILEEIETASINLSNRRLQFAAVLRETKALGRNRDYAREQFDAGLISQIEFLDSERRWLEGKLRESVLQQGVMDARVDLIKATGGGRI